jgi:acyl-CoA synthetase (AMP-forming)/AMP-acid ligase II
MRAFIDCSEPCKAASFDRFLKKFSPAGVTASMLHVSYAMAETVFAVTQTPLGSAAPRFIVDADVLSGQKLAAPAGSSSPAVELLSAGAPLQGISVFISDDAGAVLPTDQVGEIELVGDFLFEGYFNRPELTSARFRNGRYRTGDIGFVHEGEVYVLGRTDDLIIVHGRNYLAHEIEAVTNGIPGLKAGRNVAISVFNDAMGSLDVVVIAETGDARLPEGQEQLGLKRAVKRSVAAQMGLELRDVLIVPSGWLVKTTSGKISRSLNRERYLQELARRHPMNQGVHIHE